MEKNSEAGKLERNGFGNEHAKKQNNTEYANEYRSKPYRPFSV